MRSRHLVYGIGRVGDIHRYRELEDAVTVYIDALADEEERRIMEMLYLRCMSSVAAGLAVYCSERQIQRIRARVLARLEE